VIPIGSRARKKTLPLGIPDSKCEHPAQFIEERIAPTSQCFENHFGIGMTGEAIPLSFKTRTQILTVVDLAVVGNPVSSEWVLHGLMAERRKIKDGEPAITQPTFASSGTRTQDHSVMIVRSAMGKRLRGRSKPQQESDRLQR